MIETSEINLIPFTWEHVEPTFEWVKDPEFQRLFLMRGIPSKEKHQSYFNTVLADKTQRLYAVLHQGRHVGNGGIKNIDPEKKEGELWIYVGSPVMRGKGTGKCATNLLIKEAFERMNLLIIYVHVAKFNHVALKMYEHLGFKKCSDNIVSEDWQNRQHEIIKMKLKRHV